MSDTLNKEDLAPFHKGMIRNVLVSQAQRMWGREIAFLRAFNTMTSEELADVAEAGRLGIIDYYACGVDLDVGKTWPDKSKFAALVREINEGKDVVSAGDIIATYNAAGREDEITSHVLENLEAICPTATSDIGMEPPAPPPLKVVDEVEEPVQEAPEEVQEPVEDEAEPEVVETVVETVEEAPKAKRGRPRKTETVTQEKLPLEVNAKLEETLEAILKISQNLEKSLSPVLDAIGRIALDLEHVHRDVRLQQGGLTTVNENLGLVLEIGNDDSFKHDIFPDGGPVVERKPTMTIVPPPEEESEEVAVSEDGEESDELVITDASLRTMELGDLQNLAGKVGVENSHAIRNPTILIRRIKGRMSSQ